MGVFRCGMHSLTPQQRRSVTFALDKAGTAPEGQKGLQTLAPAPSNDSVVTASNNDAPAEKQCTRSRASPVDSNRGAEQRSSSPPARRASRASPRRALASDVTPRAVASHQEAPDLRSEPIAPPVGAQQPSEGLRGQPEPHDGQGKRGRPRGGRRRERNTLQA